MMTVALAASAQAAGDADTGSDFAAGEELFRLNRPAEAIAVFERIIDDKDVNPAAFVYLGVAYYQVGDYRKSLAVCTSGLERAGADRKVLAYNAGNSAYALGDYARADSCYAIAMQEDPGFSAAYLNRANAQLKLDRLEDAREQYQSFLAREPDNAQRPAIEQLLALLDEEIVRRENEKPELITPETLSIANEAMQIPEAAERITPDELPGEPVESVIEELVDADEFAAPALPPEELTLERGERVAADELPPPPNPPEAETDIEEAVVREMQEEIPAADDAK